MGKNENYHECYNSSGGRMCNNVLKKTFFCLFFVSLCFVQTYAHSQTIRKDVNFTNAGIESVMQFVKSNYGYSFLMDDNAINYIPKVDVQLKNASVEDVLKGALAGTDFNYRIVQKTITIYRTNNGNKTANPTSQAQQIYNISGTVVDEKNMPMAGVTIVLDSTYLGVATDIDGKFTLRSTKKSGYLNVTFVGYKPQRVHFDYGTPIKISMQVNQEVLDEVQIVAYGNQKKRTTVGAISSVKAEEMKELPTHSLESLLQGHMAGVEVNNVSGSPGGGGTLVSIRGYNSMFVKGEGEDRRYGQPLYVVDGVPMQAFTSPVTGSNTLSDIDPAMIESIEVLKDAASASLYGSRAGNGVILITTKKGKSGKANFSVNASYSASWLPQTPILSGGHSYERLFHLYGLRNTLTPYFKDGEWKEPSSFEEVYMNRGDDGPELDYFWNSGNGADALILQDSLNEFYNNSTDWWRHQYKVANVYNVNFQVSGGSDKSRYMMGASYYDEGGIVINTGFKRANLTSNFSVNATEKIKIDLQSSLTYSDRSRGSNASGTGSKIEGIGADPMHTSTLYPGGGIVEEEMLKIINNTTEKNQSYSARSNIRLDYEIIKNLHLNLSAGFDFNQQNQNIFKPSTLDSYSHMSTSSGTIARNISLLNENLLTYDFKINDVHNFTAMLGLSFQKDQTFNNTGLGKNGPNDKIQYVGSGWGNSDGLIDYDGYTTSAFHYGSSFEEERMNSYFGRLTYNYKEKYMFEATIRRDGSSVFGENVRWATFPSLAVGWAFSEESFMKRFYWLSFAKIRASWGKSGRKFAQRYLAHGLISPNGSFHGNSGMAPSTEGGLINKDLTWEETDQYDLGLDATFWDHRIRFTFDYYYRYTSGQLMQVDLPGNIYLHNFQWRNALAVSNQGMEYELRADLFRETAVKWRTKINISRNWNRFEKSYDKRDFNSAVLGKPIYQMEVYKTNGFYSNISDVPFFYNADGEKQLMYSGIYSGIFYSGTRQLVDLNGDGQISEEDMYYNGSPLPKAYGGWANEIQWRNFDLNILFSFSFGRKALKIYDDFSLAPSNASGPILADVKNLSVWSPSNPNAEYPILRPYSRLQSQLMGYYDSDIENVHMLRMKQITLGYNLPEKILKTINLSNVRVFGTFENLFLLTNYSGLDPELIDITVGSDNMRSYPLPRKFTIGLTVNF